ncbi:abhydrolase domain-containing protein 16B [Pontoporia blainvillei]|uniref:Abhydrolase domain-containing protein 16B n=1 Tax=Pontoporia blainvillei TaxID=48723 RepID=A0ABX0SA29_PONBL|nr:abhydrolase domain-containing protein 16B [Pontoporia blainvillei]
MFMDCRQRPGSHGRGLRLVICCEGNAGFYEIGCLSAPLEAGYSVLGWNHPGFGGSTGAPFPQHDADADANATDVVVKYALHRLHFPPAHVVVYGWSIGGFMVSWATTTCAATSGPLRPLPSGDVEGHRGNELLLRLLQHRYPAVMACEGLTVVTRWLRAGSLAQEAAFYARYRVDDDWCLALLRSYRAHCEDRQEDEEAWGSLSPG